MTNKPQNPPAFPEGIAVSAVGDVYGGNDTGMTLLDYFAAKALPSAISIIGSPLVCTQYEAIKNEAEANRAKIAKIAYSIAAAMLLEREKYMGGE